MKLLFEQPMTQEDAGSTFLQNLGIGQCYARYLFADRDSEYILVKYHQHASYELHMVNTGEVTYRVRDTLYTISSGQFLLLPPFTLHEAQQLQPGTSMVSFSFYLADNSDTFPIIARCVHGEMNRDIQDCLRLIISEQTYWLHGYSHMVTSALAQTLILLWRLCGIQNPYASRRRATEHARLNLAMQYIQDNIDHAPTVSEVSAYCNMSAKQLSRLFVQANEMTLAEYIRSMRIKRIEHLLKHTELSLHDISEQMHFSSEYYFNTFFKQYAGFPPGVFRKKRKPIG